MKWIMLAAAAAPALFLMWVFYRADRRPEPRRVVWGMFALGCLTAPAVVPMAIVIKRFVFDMALVENVYLAGLGGAFLLAAVPEEGIKFLALMLYAYRHRAFDEPMDGIVYGAVASLGFAAIENAMYVSEGGLALAAGRAFTSVPCHALLGAIMGLYVGRAKFRTGASRAWCFVAALFWPILWHTLYDFPLLSFLTLSNRDLEPNAAQILLVFVTLGTLIVMPVWTIRAVRRLRREQRDQMLPLLAIPGRSPESLTPPPAPVAERSRVLMSAIGGLMAIPGLFVAFACFITYRQRGGGAQLSSPLVISLLGVATFVIGVVLFLVGSRLRREQTKPPTAARVD